MSAGMIEVLAPGLLTTVQDTGRRGYAALGIGRAGAADVAALRLANALVGNPDDAATLEFTLNGPRVRFARAAEIALTGAPFVCTVDDQAVPTWTPLAVAAGSVLNIGGAPFGCRGYLAVAGGITVPQILASRSQDVNSRLGPFDGRPLRAGDELPLGCPGPRAADGELRWSLAARCWTEVQQPAILHLMEGTHTPHLTAASRTALFESDFRVGAASNRVGCRLEGPPLTFQHPLELISEGVVPGTLQLPPSGEAIALLGEAPVTGGYPRIGHIVTPDLTRLAQLRPGDHLRFVPISSTLARERTLRKERQLRALQAHIARRRRTAVP